MFLPLTFIALLGLVASQQFDAFGRPSGNNNQLPCGFVCTRNAAFTTIIDGQNTRATCTASNANVNERCPSCCQAYALSGGLTAADAAGFPSTDGNSCVCCVNNDRCGGRG